MTDYVEVLETVDEPDSLFCEVCGITPDSVNTPKGLKLHLSRMHGIKSAPIASDTPPIPKGPKPKVPKSTGGKKPFISTSNNLSATGRDLTLDLLAAAAAWLAVRWIAAQGVGLTKREQEAFVIDERDRKVMFKPLLDGLEQIAPVVRILNTVAERFDYIQCFLLWKAYIKAVSEFVEIKKEGIVSPDGYTGQSTTAHNGKESGTDAGEFQPPSGDEFQRSERTFGEYIA